MRYAPPAVPADRVAVGAADPVTLSTPNRAKLEVEALVAVPPSRKSKVVLASIMVPPLMRKGVSAPPEQVPDPVTIPPTTVTQDAEATVGPVVPLITTPDEIYNVLRYKFLKLSAEVPKSVLELDGGATYDPFTPFKGARVIFPVVDPPIVNDPFCNDCIEPSPTIATPFPVEVAETDAVGVPAFMLRTENFAEAVVIPPKSRSTVVF